MVFDVPSVMAVAIVVGAAGVLFVATGPSAAGYVLALAAFGIGYGLCWSLTSIGTQTVVPVTQAGAASGVTLTIVIGLAGLAVALASSLIETLGPGTGEGAVIDDILRVLAITSVVLGTGLAIVARAMERRIAPDAT